MIRESSPSIVVHYGNWVDLVGFKCTGSDEEHFIGEENDIASDYLCEDTYPGVVNTTANICGTNCGLFNPNGGALSTRHLE